MEYTFAKPATVTECGLYWFDDTGQGSVRVPASWRLLYKDGDEWKPVETTDAFSTKDRFNKVTFKPVTHRRPARGSDGAAQFSVGIQKWTVK